MVTTQSQQTVDQIIPPSLQSAFYSPAGVLLVASVSGLILARALQGRGRSSKLARAKWAGAAAKAAARKVALRQIQERKHNRVALFIGTPKRSRIEITRNQRILHLPEDPSRLYLPDAQRGILVCGGPGSGKTFSMISPCIRSAINQGFPIVLYDYKYAHQESATAAPKGMAAKLAGYAIEQGYKVTLLAPGFPESSIANPLDFIRSETDAEMARQLAIVLNRNFQLTAGGDDGFFANAGDQLVQAILMFVKGSPYQDVLMCQAILELPDLIRRLQQADLNPWVRAAFAQFMSTAGSPETASSIAATASGVFSRFMVPSSLAAFCGKTNIPLDLKGRQMVIFGMDRERRDAIGPLLISILHLLVSRNVAGKRTDPLVLGLDELPTTYLPALVDWLNQNREDGLVSILGFQNLSQLEDAYGEKVTNAIFAGCATKAFFNPQDDVAAEKFSNFLGREEIKYNQRSRSRGGKSGASVTNAEQISARDMYEVNQFNSLREGEAIIVGPGFRDKKSIGLPILEKIEIPSYDQDAEKRSVRIWYKKQQEMAARFILKEPTKKEMQQRFLEAWRMLPLVDKNEETLKIVFAL